MTFDFVIIHYNALKIRNRILGFLKITLNFQNFSCNFLGIVLQKVVHVHLSRNGDGTEQKEDAGIFPEKQFFRKFPAFVLLRDALFLHMHIMVQTQSQYSSTTNELKYVCM